jgi:hypothetical protein
VSIYDTGDDMRASTWDMPPGTDLETLLGALGAARQPLAYQRAELRLWLASPAAIPAPPKLLAAVRAFLEVPLGEEQ